MSFIQINLGDDVKEAGVADEGTYSLTASFVAERESKNTGRPMIVVGHVINGEADIAPIYKYLNLPQEGDEPSTVKMFELEIKRYLTMIGLEYDPTGFDSDLIYGQDFEAYVTKDEILDDEGNPKNPPDFRNNISVPKLAAE